MVELSDEQFEAAIERGRAVFETEPHAKAVRHDLKSGMTIVDLQNGCTFAFPPRRLQGLEQATDAQLLEVEVIGRGFGLHWESLDADYTVPGLMAGRFGTPAYMERERARLRAMFDNDPRHHAA